MYRYGTYYSDFTPMKRSPHWMQAVMRESRAAEALLSGSPQTAYHFSRYRQAMTLQFEEYARVYYRRGWRHGCGCRSHRRIFR